MSVDSRQIAAEASALKAAGRLDRAIALYRQLVDLAPRDGYAQHNLAAALADAGLWRDAEPHVRLAKQYGVEAPETDLVLARCLQFAGQLDAAEAAFLTALRKRPTFHDAHRDLAQLRWMRTGDASTALVEIERALLQAPGEVRLMLLKAQVLEQIGDLESSYELLTGLSATLVRDAFVANAASQAAAAIGDVDTALVLAERAAAAAPRDPVIAITLITACLAAGHADRASLLAEAMRSWAPNDQHVLALEATAWRLLGDPRYGERYDYEALVRVQTIDTPRSWPHLDAYLSDLAQGLRQAHAFRTHPFNQSIKHGAQVSDVLHHDHPALRALPEALDGPIMRYIEGLAPGADPLRARNTGLYAFQGMWSIRMGPGGFHIDHVHPLGWLSSALYVELPNARKDQEGWIKFGQPGIRTSPALEAEFFVEPAPGAVVIFPSYMWHGTVPFTDDSHRLTVAFDLAPA